MIETYHVIEASYQPYTNKLPDRIRLHSERFNQTIFVSCQEYETGADYLRKNGFNVIGSGMIKNGVALITDTFEPLKPRK